MAALSDFDRGLLVGLLISQGSFGGDGKQPQVTLRMHIRHENLCRWLTARVPGSRLYGPYHHASRDYYQWMVRGRPLVTGLLPLLESEIQPELDVHAHARLRDMMRRYEAVINRDRDQESV